MKLAMGQGEVCLEIGPSFVGVVLELPSFAIVQENAGCEENLKCGGDDLVGGIGSIASSGIVEGVFDLVKEAFDRLIGILGGIEGDIIVLEVGYRDVSVLGV